MNPFNKVKTIQDYIYVLCYYKAITIEQMCKDLNIPYDLFVTNISELIDNKLLSEIMDYLDGDILFAFDLPLTSDKNNSLPVLPSNILSPDEFKHIVFESRSERYMQFSRSVNHYTRQNNIRTKILSTMDLVNIVKSFTDIIAEPFEINGTVEYRLYERGYDKPIYYMLTSETLQSNLDDIQYVLSAENSSIWRKATSVMHHLTVLAGSNEFPKFNPAPSYYVLTLNGIFNRKTKEFYPENSTEYNKLTSEYHFIDNASFNYLTESKNPQIVELYKEFIEHISDGDEDLKNKIEQQLCSVLEGHNHDGLTFISSYSDRNLCVFSKVIRTLASVLLYEYANICETRKDSDLSYIKYNSKLLTERLLKCPNKLSPKAIEKCKQIFNGESFITSKQKGYKTYFKLRMPWFQLVKGQKYLNLLKRDTKGIKSVTININNKDLDYDFAKKFTSTIDKYSIPPVGDITTEFSDEVGSYLLNKTNLPAN
jgi:hypothetical protein